MSLAGEEGSGVSVVLPLREPGPLLAPLLDALEAQVVEGGKDVLALDSGSRDGTREELRARGVRTLEVAPDEFDHGGTRNRGAREARGTEVVFLSQDALPVGERFLAELVAPLRSDRRLAGAFARQEPRPEADPLTRRDLAAAVVGGEEARAVFLADWPGFDSLPPLARQRLAAFDNVASAVRREALLAHPFPASRFGEDAEWGLRVLRLGLGLAYVPAAVVLHSHARSARCLFRRNYLAHRLLFRLFGLRTVPDRRHLLRAAVGAAAGDVALLGRSGSRPGAWPRAAWQAAAAAYGQYRGARDEARGKPHPPWA